MLLPKFKAMILSLLAMLLAGSIMAPAASAEAGPFWHHRAIGGKGEGEKIEEKEPETFTSKGGRQQLSGVIGGQKVLIESESTEGKEGKIFNGPHQGQIIFTNDYHEPKLIEPVLKECTVKVGTNDEVPLKGHLMWKWDGSEKQLNEQPQLEQTVDIGFTVIDPPQQKPKVEVDLRHDGTFTPITFSGAGCGVLAGKFNVSGSDVAIPNRKLGEFSTKLSVRTIQEVQVKEKGFLQHYWDGTEFQGAKLGLVFGSEPASLVGQTENESTKQEIAAFEK